MSERRLVVEAGLLLQRGEPFVTATVVDVKGSSYRRPGARMLLTRDRWIAGSVSGGCLEDELLRKAFWLTRDTGSALLRYDSRGGDELDAGLGLGCDGVIDLLLERAGSRPFDALQFVSRCHEQQARGVLATVFDEEPWGRGARVGLRAGSTWESDIPVCAERAKLEALASTCLVEGDARVLEVELAGHRVRVLVEAVTPPACMFIFGDRHDAPPVALLSKGLGWEVVGCVPTVRHQTRERLSAADALLAGPPQSLRDAVERHDRALAVLMSHDYERDRAALEMLLGTRALYIAVLGPRRRTERMVDDLGLPGLDARVHAPAGLAIGAETPQEIALAIVAEAQAVLTSTSGRSLRERRGSIHASARAELLAAE